MKLFASLHNEFSRLTKDEEGASAIEYALIAGLIAIVISTAASGVGSAIVTKLGAIATALA